MQAATLYARAAALLVLAAAAAAAGAACADSLPDCPEWAQMGQCDRNPSVMRARCRQSCGLCSADDCADETPGSCVGWAQGGECTRNPKFMQASCRKSCGLCGPGCADAEADCQHWAWAG
eukprot:3531140-Prymnesium_polylepis.1